MTCGVEEEGEREWGQRYVEMAIGSRADMKRGTKS